MSINQLEIGDAVDEIINEPTPILFVDTCVLLDLIRLPFRQKKPTTARAYLDSAENAIRLTKEKKLKIVILPLIQKEFEDNFAKTKSELSHHIKDTISRMEVLISLHSSGLEKLSIPDSLSSKTELVLEKACRDLLSLGIHVKQHDELVLKANERVVNNIPPSTKGAIQDCIIYEHCLKISSLLRNQGFTEKIMFFTSNSNDYCERNGNAKQPICNEFSDLKIELCLNWSWAINKVC
ncbi:MAG: hypothetical protein WBG70_09460 [Spirulinaceae cyanobacterium]